MENMKERLDELESRVQKLEQELQSIRGKQKNKSSELSSDLIVDNGDVLNNPVLESISVIERLSKEDNKTASTVYEGNSDESFVSDKKARNNSVFENFKSNESLVGKYLVGALASLLIFIAAASFIAIVWNKISPEVKLGTVSIIGLLLTGYGFNMTLKKPSNVSSIVFGTGIGLVYISIVSANLVFGLISHNASALLCVVWTLLILFSHSYTKLYFTIIVAGIGNFINLSFELGYVKNPNDILLIIAYTTVVSVMLLYVSDRLDKVRNVISILFVFFNFAWIFLWTDTFRTVYPLAQTIVTFIMILVANWMYRLANKENINYTYFIVTIFSTLFLYFSVDMICYVGLLKFQASTIFTVVILAQFIANHILYKNIEEELTMFYTFPLYVGFVGIYGNLFDLFIMGATPIIILFILREKIWKKDISVLYIMLLTFFDFVGSLLQSNIWTLVFNIANLCLIFYILYNREVKNMLYKNVAVGMLLLYYFKISHDICNLLYIGNYFIYIDKYFIDVQNFVAYLMSVGTLIFIYKIGYLNSKDEKRSHLNQNRGLYLFSVLLYFFGMREMLHTSLGVFRFIIMLATLVIALFQSKLFLSDYEKVPNHIGIWLVSKYFMFTWVVMKAFLQLPFDSVSYSVVGLLLAVVAIYVGFKMGIKVIRQFGLFITMLMVAKFIFVDLQGENSITRVIAFAVGGVLCFVISIIYNRLSKE